jgi:cytochrome c-type biogenesis protein
VGLWRVCARSVNIAAHPMTEFLTQLPLAFASGLISVFSPCVMPLMPAYLSLISGVSVEAMGELDEDGERRARVMRSCLGFVCGFSAVFMLLGVSAFTIGRALRGWRLDVFGLEIGIAQLAGVAIIVMGLHLTGLFRLGWLLRDTRLHLDMGPQGFGSAFVVGAGFGFGWSPCIGPILGAVLTLAGSRETVFEGIGLLAVYSAGLGVPFLLAGWSIDYFFRAFSRIKQHFRALEIGSGAILVAVGLLLVTNQLSWFNGQFAFLADFVVWAEESLQ